MSSYHVDQAFQIEEANGIEAFRAVVRGSDERRCKLPQAANDSGFVGFTTHSQQRHGRMIAIRRAGFAQATAAGPVAIGDDLVIADANGRVKKRPAPVYTFGSAGSNNGLQIAWLLTEFYHATLSVELHYPGGSSSFGWELKNGALVITVEGAGGFITQSANSLIAAIEGDADLSKLIAVEAISGSSGSASVAEESKYADNVFDQLNVIGRAESPASGSGSRFTAFINS